VIANGVEGLSDRAFGQGRLIGRERQGESET